MIGVLISRKGIEKDMKKIILFDWGNVLLNSDSEQYDIFKARKDIISELNPGHPEILAKIFSDNDFWTTNGDRLSSLIEEYLRKSNCNHSVKEFKDCYLKHYYKVPWFEDTVSLFNKLVHDSTISIGILSSLCEMDLELLKKRLDIKNIDYLFFTYEIGLQKPDKRILDIIEDVTKCIGKDILYIDDKIENINEAKKKHWDTVLATGHDISQIKESCNIFKR